MSGHGDLVPAHRVVEQAWRDLPVKARNLLESIKADAWEVTDSPLGTYADALRRSGGFGALSDSDRRRADGAVGLWLPEPRLVLINVSHPSLHGLDESTLAYALARIAWHEWAHALSIHRATGDDVAAGKRLLERVPAALARNVRSSGYLRREYTHEIVAEIYAMLMIRRRLDGATDRPAWLSQEVYDLVRRVAGWNQ